MLAQDRVAEPHTPLDASSRPADHCARRPELSTLCVTVSSSLPAPGKHRRHGLLTVTEPWHWASTVSCHRLLRLLSVGLGGLASPPQQDMARQGPRCPSPLEGQGQEAASSGRSRGTQGDAVLSPQPSAGQQWLTTCPGAAQTRVCSLGKCLLPKCIPGTASVRTDRCTRGGPGLAAVSFTHYTLLPDKWMGGSPAQRE